ncbi:MAG: FKBP-type peptidyl-prolyl cis-trans isomerase [Mangrovibacterium sp.]
MSEKQFKNRLEKFSYALGLSIAGNMIQSGVTEIDRITFSEALEDVFDGKDPKLPVDEANRILQSFMAEQQNSSAGNNLEAGMSFLAENRKDKEVIETESGLQYKVLNEGTGEKPGTGSQVKCHYHGTLIDGTVFDSSVQRGKPAVFPVNGVIQGWVEALQLMREGSKWRLFIPPMLAYGENGAGGSIGPNATLIFDVELLEIV